MQNFLIVNVKIGYLTGIKKALLKENINTTRDDEKNATALHWAIWYKDIGIVKYLISQGADVNAEDIDLNTPLHWAVVQRNYDAVVLLLKHPKTCLTPINIYTKTPSDYCQYSQVGSFIDNVFSKIFNKEREKKYRIFNLINDELLKYEQEALNECRKKSDGNLEKFIAIMDRGVDINYADSSADTLLIDAIWYGNNKIAKWLLENGANYFHRNKKGDTAFLFACSSGNTEVMEWFFEKNFLLKKNIIDINDKSDQEKRTPLHWATSNNKLAAVKLLWERFGHKLDLFHEDINGHTAYDIAINQGNDELAEYLKNKEFVFIKLQEEMQENAKKALEECRKNNGNLELFISFMEHGVDLNYTDKDGNTLLMESIWYENNKIAKWLFDKGADVALRNNNGNTAFIIAAAKGNLEFIELLAKNEFQNINELGNFKRTALQWAVRNNKIKAVELLCKLAFKETDCQIGFRIDNGELVIVLHKLGDSKLDFDHEDENGETAYTLAYKKGYKDIKSELLYYSARAELHRDTLNETAAEALKECRKGSDCDLKLFQSYMEKGIWINYKDDDGDTFLINAIWYGSNTIVEWLLENGADYTSKRKSGSDAFIVACHRGNNQAIVLLQNQYFVDPNVLGALKRTGLQSAVANGHLATVQLLHSSYGSRLDLNHRDENDETAYNIAVKEGYVNIPDLLKKMGSKTTLPPIEMEKQMITDGGIVLMGLILYPIAAPLGGGLIATGSSGLKYQLTANEYEYNSNDHSYQRLSGVIRHTITLGMNHMNVGSHLTSQIGNQEWSPLVVKGTELIINGACSSACHYLVLHLCKKEFPMFINLIGESASGSLGAIISHVVNELIPSTINEDPKFIPILDGLKTGIATAVNSFCVSIVRNAFQGNPLFPTNRELNEVCISMIIEMLTEVLTSAVRIMIMNRELQLDDDDEEEVIIEGESIADEMIVIEKTTNDEVSLINKSMSERHTQEYLRKHAPHIEVHSNENKISDTHIIIRKFYNTRTDEVIIALYDKSKKIHYAADVDTFNDYINSKNSLVYNYQSHKKLRSKILDITSAIKEAPDAYYFKHNEKPPITYDALTKTITPRQAYRFCQAIYKKHPSAYIQKHFPDFEVVDKAMIANKKILTAKIDGYKCNLLRNKTTNELIVVVEGTHFLNINHVGMFFKSLVTKPSSVREFEKLLNKWESEYGKISVLMGHSVGGYIITHARRSDKQIQKITFNGHKNKRGENIINLSRHDDFISQSRIFGGVKDRTTEVGPIPRHKHGIFEHTSKFFPSVHRHGIKQFDKAISKDDTWDVLLKERSYSPPQI